MNDAIARAILETKDSFSYGYVWVRNSILEGTFTLDYVKIKLRKRKLYFNIREKLSFVDKDGLHNSYNYHYYFSNYHYDNLFVSNKYTFYDNDNSPIILNILETTEDTNLKSLVKNSIKHSR